MVLVFVHHAMDAKAPCALLRDASTFQGHRREHGFPVVVGLGSREILDPRLGHVCPLCKKEGFER